jgi:hypothetical protein
LVVGVDTQVEVDNQVVEDENHYVAVNIQVVEVVEVGNLIVVMVNYLPEEENPVVGMINFLAEEENLVDVEMENLIAAILNWVVVEILASVV